MAPRIWRVALLRDLYAPPNNLDNSDKPPRRAALQRWSNHYRRKPREPGGSRSCATCMSPRTISIIPTSRPGVTSLPLEQSLSPPAPRIWRVALLRDLYEPANNLDYFNKPPGRAALQRRRNQLCRIWPRESGGSRSCATCMNPRVIPIIRTSRPGGRPSNIDAINPIASGPANLEGRASARLV